MGSYSVRTPAVAGQFYPDDPRELKAMLAGFMPGNKATAKAIGCMLPHAGYIYSGNVAGQTLVSTIVPQKILLMGPNHTGLGAEFSLMREGSWETPLGQVKIDSQLADHFLKGSRYLKEDTLAHLNEHSLEVELPFLQYLNPEFCFVPITLMCESLAALKELGQEIGRVIASLKLQDKILMVASSDMTHYEPQKLAQKKDEAAIKIIETLDEDALVAKVMELKISMCGLAPVITMLSAAKILGATKGKLITYETSARASGDATSVVGYAGIIIT